MVMIRIFSFIVLVFCLCLGTYSVAQPQENEGALGELVEALDRIETLSATFVQYSVDQRGARIQESKGELKAERGGKFFWRTYEPLEQIVVSNGKDVTVYDPDLEQATIQKIGSQASTTPAILFSGDTKKIGQLFDVTLNSFEPTIRQFDLKPKSEDNLFERLKLVFSGNNVSELRITDALGQESTMSFIQTQVNLQLPKDTFIPSLPPGTDIIRDVQVPAN